MIGHQPKGWQREKGGGWLECCELPWCFCMEDMASVSMQLGKVA